MAIGSHGRGRGGTVGDGRLAVGRRVEKLFSFSGAFVRAAVKTDLLYQFVAAAARHTTLGTRLTRGAARPGRRSLGSGIAPGAAEPGAPQGRPNPHAATRPPN